MRENKRSNANSIVLLTAILLTISFINPFAQTGFNKGELRIASSQFPVSADIDSNAYWIKKHIKEAGDKGAALVHFPECALSGYAGVDFKTFENFD